MVADSQQEVSVCPETTSGCEGANSVHTEAHARYEVK
jgi:hypothetical protein